MKLLRSKSVSPLLLTLESRCYLHLLLYPLLIMIVGHYLLQTSGILVKQFVKTNSIGMCVLFHPISHLW